MIGRTSAAVFQIAVAFPLVGTIQVAVFRALRPFQRLAPYLPCHHGNPAKDEFDNLLTVGCFILPPIQQSRFRAQGYDRQGYPHKKEEALKSVFLVGLGRGRFQIRLMSLLNGFLYHSVNINLNYLENADANCVNHVFSLYRGGSYCRYVS